MRAYYRIFGYLTYYKGRIGLYGLFVLLSILFSIVSIGMLMPFLQLIFTGQGSASLTQSSNQLIQSINQYLAQSVQEKGNVQTLGLKIGRAHV